MPRYLPISIAGLLSAVTVFVGVQQMTDIQLYPKDMLHGSAPEVSDIDLTDDENLGATYATYESETLKYSLRHLASWTLDDSHKHGNIDILSDSRALAIITISKVDDPDLCDPWVMENLLHTMEKAATYDPTLTQTSYAKVPWKRHWAVMGSGRRERADGSWLVRNFIVARPEYGGTLNITTQIRSDVETLFADDVQAILDSLSVNQGEY